MNPKTHQPLIVLACGGTGGHLFPGIAVADELIAQGARARLLISDKSVDQVGIKSAPHLEAVTLPAIGLTRGRAFSFLQNFCQACFFSRRLFASDSPRAVIAMGGFTSAAPVLTGKWMGARTFIHEANSVAGRANRLLARWVDQVFVYFPEARQRLKNPAVLRTGMPVRNCFQKMDPAGARAALGFDPSNPVLLIMGGSQGASGINQLLLDSLPMLKRVLPELQFLHLTGEKDAERASSIYRRLQVKALVRPFLTEMDLALASATLAISRAGASSLAEFAAMSLPALLVPYPAAADNHQWFNAMAFARSGAAHCLDQREASADKLIPLVVKLMENTERGNMTRALAQWHFPAAARGIACEVLARIGLPLLPEDPVVRPLPEKAPIGQGALGKKEILELISSKFGRRWNAALPAHLPREGGVPPPP